MKKLLGIIALFAVVFTFTAMNNPNFVNPLSIESLLGKTGMFGFLGIGAALVIITGGIDLSIGSVVGLTGTVVTYLLADRGWTPGEAIPLAIGVCAVLGLFHGLLVTKLKLQPFVVTLCGLLIYRGIARFIAGNQSRGFGEYHATLDFYATGTIAIPGLTFGIPVSFLLLLGLTIVTSIFLHGTIYGRYLYAIGRNEQAAQYSGIKSDRIKIAAYVLCSTLSGIGGLLLAVDGQSVQAAQLGNFYELYAIAAAVLGGCSLTGGEGSAVGVIVGTALLRVLFKVSNFIKFENFTIPDDLEFAVVGVVLLIGVVIDEIAKRIVHRLRQSKSG